MLRRQLLSTLALAPAAMAPASLLQGQQASAEPSVALGKNVRLRQLTRGPKFHWFGYYDKQQVDASGRYALANQVAFEHRSPREDDVLRVGMVDMQDGDRWIDLGETRAWNWQQGCMLQWVPGRKNEVLWNDRVDGQFVAHIVNVKTGKRRTLPSPVYTIANNGRWGITCDFRRLNDVRPGYGYAGIIDPNRDKLVPEDVGIWRVDLETGQKKLLLSVADAQRIPYPKGYSNLAKHWFNHLLISPDDKRFIFLHRWRGDKEGTSFATRMFTANADGTGLYVLDPHGKTSHFVWRDGQSVIAWAWHPSKGDKFYLYKDQTEQVEVLGESDMTVNGHCTYLPGTKNRFILNDTYPDKARMQNVYLYDLQRQQRLAVGSFPSPKAYQGEWRCDTHPRGLPGGRAIIDSAHSGGRQMYLLEFAPLLR